MRPDGERQFTELFAKRRPKPVDEIRPGIERVQEAYRRLGRPGITTPTVLVAGTNGKGTTSCYLARLLSANGRVGLFTSPHFLSFAERFWLSDRSVSVAQIARCINSIADRLSAEIYDQLSFFEVTTLAALEIFSAAQTKFNVLEVGLGGRWDATNICDPVLSVITTIGKDHEQFLGHDIATIAKEKAGILRSRRPVVWQGKWGGDSKAHHSIVETAAELNCPVQMGEIDFSVDENLVHWHDRSVTMPRELRAAPLFLRRNFAQAAASYRLLATASNLKQIDQAILNFPFTPMPTSLRGRFERHSDRLIVDVCHNPHGLSACLDALDAMDWFRHEGETTALVSTMKDKAIDTILDMLSQRFDHTLLFGNASERSFTRSDLAHRHLQLPWFDCFEDAWDHLSEPETPRRQMGRTLICGSVMALGPVLHQLDRLADGSGPNLKFFEK